MADEIETEKTITLRKPVTVGDKTYTELKLHEPTAKQIAFASRKANDAEQTIMLIAQVAGVPPAAAEQLIMRDFQEAAAFFAGFTPPGAAETGET